MQSSKHLAVNWIDGMKISKEHLVQQEAFITDAFTDCHAARLNSLNYGLLAPLNDSGRSLNVKINVDPSKIIRVNLLECHAVNGIGERIEIAQGSGIKYNSDSDKLTTDFDFSESKEKVFYITVAVNLFARNPVGQPDADEIPPRYPFVTPQYSVAVLPASQVNDNIENNSIFIVGKLQLNAGRMQVMDKFIPPSTSVKSHPLLLESYYNLGNQLGETANLNLFIVQKIHAKSQSTSLIKSFMALSEKVSDFLANDLGRFRWMIADLPPVYLVEHFIRFAYVIKFSLDRLPPKDKEELLSYFSEWSDLSLTEISEKITEMIKSEYNHNDIAQSLNKAEEFMFMVHTIFTKLNALDFIGKKKGERAFVQERTFEEVKEETPPPKEKKKGFSFLAD